MQINSARALKPSLLGAQVAGLLPVEFFFCALRTSLTSSEPALS